MEELSFLSVLKQLLLFVHLLFDYCLDYVFSWFEHRPVKEQIFFKTSNPVLFESASSLALKIRNKELTSQRIVQAYIDRINVVNVQLNALVDTCFVRALNEARQIDEDIASGKYSPVEFDKKPFLGVPFTTKESTACEGLSWTFGIYARAHKRATEDATVVENMRRAGAILLGVSNIPQLNLWVESDNPLFGRTNNPYDLSRNVGGSSGGEGAIISACASPFGIGTDIGGSIRIPSFMNGIFGHKCSANLVSTKGLTYRDGSTVETMVTAGPMCRFSEDLAPLLAVICGKTTIEKLQLETPVDIKKLKYYYIASIDDVVISPIRKETQRVFMKVVDYMGNLTNTKPEQLKLDGLKYTRKLYTFWLSQEKNCNFKRDLMDRQGEASLMTEIVKFALRNEPNNLSSILNIINAQCLPKVDEKWAREVTAKLKEELLGKLGSDGVLLFPSAPFPARRHYSNYLQLYNFLYFAIFNVLHLPVTQVPLGLGSEGLPHGIQVVGAPYADRHCFAVARELERVYGGHQLPFYREMS